MNSLSFIECCRLLAIDPKRLPAPSCHSRYDEEALILPFFSCGNCLE
jgi:hypothetical protein